MPDTTTLAAQLLLALRAHGATEVFGIPGDFALPFFGVMEATQILPLYTLSHEPAVGFAADAAARSSGGLGVAAVTYGAGALNMVNPIAGAYAERVPIVVISGAPGVHESASGLLLHHQVRSLDTQARVYAEITCDQARLDDPATAPREIARVLASAIRHSQPVYIELPRDCVSLPCAPVPPLPPPPPVDPDALAACAEEILGRLAGARQPVLMVGVEVRRFGLEGAVAQLAHRLGVPVVTSLMGRGLLAHEDAPLQGTYLGVAGDPAISDLVEEADPLLLLGVIASDTNLAVSSRRLDLRKTIHAFGGEVHLGYHVYPRLPLAALVHALLDAAPAAAQHDAARPAEAWPSGLREDDTALTPGDIATATNDLLAREGKIPLATDMGDCLFTAMDISHTDLIAPGYYATMGYGVPAGLGLQAATGQRPLILVGDGAFQMTGWELGNCRRYGWDPVVIVFNNASWEMLRAFQPGPRYHDLGAWDYTALANALGGRGRRAYTRAELGAALREAWAERGRFQLIEAILPPGARSPTLSRFVAGVKRLTSGGK